MKLEIRSRKFHELEVGLAYMVIGLLGWSLAYFMPDLDHLIPPCMFRSLTGIPCPACGATHSGMYLSHFHFGDAFLANPLFFFLYTALAVWGFNSLTGVLVGKNFSLNLTLVEKEWLRRSLIGIVLINWLFMIIRVLMIKPTLLY